MNECNAEFFRRNGIVIEDICSRIDCGIRTNEDVNPIIAEYGFQTDSEKEMISIADIVGYDTEFRGINKINIFLSLDNFFKEGGDGYHTRSLGMLDFNKDNIVEQLKQSFELEPMSLIETGEGSYTILNNGLHRYTLLRILYLSEIAHANGDKEKIAEIGKKYTIPAEVTGVDLDKTYCKYLLQRVTDEYNEMKVKDIETEYDGNYKRTGNAVIKYENGDKEVLTNEQMLELTKERVYEDQSFSKNYTELQRVYDKYPSFRMFIDEEFADIIPMQKRDLDVKGIEYND